MVLINYLLSSIHRLELFSENAWSFLREDVLGWSFGCQALSFEVNRPSKKMSQLGMDLKHVFADSRTLCNIR